MELVAELGPHSLTHEFSNRQFHFGHLYIQMVLRPSPFPPGGVPVPFTFQEVRAFVYLLVQWILLWEGTERVPSATMDLYSSNTRQAVASAQISCGLIENGFVSRSIDAADELDSSTSKNLTLAPNPWEKIVDGTVYQVASYGSPKVPVWRFFDFLHDLENHVTDIGMETPTPGADMRNQRLSFSAWGVSLELEAPRASRRFTIGHALEIVKTVRIWAMQWSDSDLVPSSTLKISVWPARDVIAQGDLSCGYALNVQSSDKSIKSADAFSIPIRHVQKDLIGRSRMDNSVRARSLPWAITVKDVTFQVSGFTQPRVTGREFMHFTDGLSTYVEQVISQLGPHTDHSTWPEHRLRLNGAGITLEYHEFDHESQGQLNLWQVKELVRFLRLWGIAFYPNDMVPSVQLKAVSALNGRALSTGQIMCGVVANELAGRSTPALAVAFASAPFRRSSGGFDIELSSYRNPEMSLLLFTDFTIKMTNYVMAVCFRYANGNIFANWHRPRFRFFDGVITITMSEWVNMHSVSLTYAQLLSVADVLRAWSPPGSPTPVPGAILKVFVSSNSTQKISQGLFTCRSADTESSKAIIARRVVPQEALGIPSSPATIILSPYLLVVDHYTQPNVDSHYFHQCLNMFKADVDVWVREEAHGNVHARIPDGKVSYQLPGMKLEMVQATERPFMYIELHILVHLLNNWAPPEVEQAIPSIQLSLRMEAQPALPVAEGYIYSGVVDGGEEETNRPDESAELHSKGRIPVMTSLSI